MRNLLVSTLVFLFPHIVAGDGIIEDGKIDSSALGVEKRYVVYLPDTYYSSRRNFPVIYLLHGFGAHESYWIDELDLAESANQLDLKAIIVMPDGDRSAFLNFQSGRDFDSCMSGETEHDNSDENRESFCTVSANYEDYFLQEIIPHIDTEYRTVRSREGRALTGESAGGFAAMHLALRNPDMFGSVASHSGWLSILYDPVEDESIKKLRSRPEFSEWEQILGLDIGNWREHDPYHLVDPSRHSGMDIYFDSGTEDEFGFHEVALHFRDRLDELGMDYEYHAVPGGRHNDAYFGNRVVNSLNFHIRAFSKRGTYPYEPGVSGQ